MPKEADLANGEELLEVGGVVGHLELVVELLIVGNGSDGASAHRGSAVEDLRPREKRSRPSQLIWFTASARILFLCASSREVPW